MATAQPIILSRLRRRWARRALLLLAALSGAALAWFWRPVHAYATAGASYGARMACSCRFIAGRALSECGKDSAPGMEWVTLSDDEADRSVTARFLLLSRQTATFRPSEGCLLETWSD